MPGLKALITFDNHRSLGIGRLTSFEQSTDSKPGFLIGSSKGLYHLEKINSRPQRIRSYPVVYIHSGENGVVCYEETGKHGQLAILNNNLEEVRVDTRLVREINPKAFWRDSLIILDKNHLAYLDLVSNERRHLVDFHETRIVGQFARVMNGYEFIAVLRGKGWPTFLFKLVLPGEGNAKLIEIARADDPIFARHFQPLPGKNYLVISQDATIFVIYRILEGDIPMLRSWSITSIPGETHPVGMIQDGLNLHLAVADCIVTFKISEELLG